MPYELIEDVAETPQQPTRFQQELGTLQNILGGLGRSAVTIPTNIVSGALGSIPSIASLGGNILNYLSGGNIPTYEQAQNKIPLPPTEEQYQTGFEKLTGGRFKPQTPGEEIVQNIASDVGGFLPTLLFGGAGPALARLGKYGKIATAANIGSKAVGEATGSPLLEGLTKLGISLKGQGLKTLGTKKKEMRKLAEEAFRSGDYDAANKIFGELNYMSNVGEFLNEHIDLKKILKSSLLTKGLYGTSLLSRPGKTLAGTALAAGTGYGAKKGVELFDLYRSSPQFAQEFTNALKEAAFNNVSAFTRHIKKADKIATKFESEQKPVGRYEIID